MLIHLRDSSGFPQSANQRKQVIKQMQSNEVMMQGRSVRLSNKRYPSSQTVQTSSLCCVILHSKPGRGALLLGDINAARDSDLLKEHQVRTIITAASELGHLKVSSQVTHIVFPILQTHADDISTFFQLSNATIEQNLKRGAVLVHCGAGISRSATLIVAYFMKQSNLSLSKSVAHLSKIRKDIYSTQYMANLQKYSQQLFPDQGQKDKQIHKKVAVVDLLDKFPVKIDQRHSVSKGFSHNKVKNTVKKVNSDKPKSKNQLFVEGQEVGHEHPYQEEGLDTNSLYGAEEYNPDKYSRSSQSGWKKPSIQRDIRPIVDQITVSKNWSDIGDLQ